MSPQISGSKVAVIGAGLVGSSFAYALAIKGMVRKIALIDQNLARAEGEAMDLSHSLALLRPMTIEAGGYELCREAHLVVVTAGAAQKEGETRLDLAQRNAAIMRDIVRRVLEHNPSPIFLVVTNPVDVLTYAVLKFSGLPPHQVIGSGTVLDSSRFRFLISDHCSVDPRNVHAYIIGEHGDSEVALWSQVHLAGVPLQEYCPVCGRGCDAQKKESLVEEVKQAAYEVIRRKGATNWAVGLAMARILEAVMNDHHSVLTVSTLVQDYYGINDVCLSLPCVLGARGVEKVIKSGLTDKEAEALKRSARILEDSVKTLGL
ncbi:MAG: L-lactate dehydrogenase [Pseudomonadota bacterium]